MKINEKWDVELRDYSTRFRQLKENTKSFLNDNKIIVMISFTSILYLIIAYVIIVYK